MKNKKKILISVLVIIIICLIAGISIISSTKKEAPAIEGKHLIAEKNSVNYAWGFQYSGTALFSDGTIYKYDFDKNDKVNSSINEYEKLIIKKGKKSLKKASKKDIEKLNNCIYNLKDNIKTKNVAWDAGTNNIYVYNIKNKKAILIKQTGDFEGMNKTIESLKIQSILKKYL